MLNAGELQVNYLNEGVICVFWYIFVFVLYTFFIIVLNLRSLKQVETFADFTTGGHRMGLWVGVFTTVATWVSVASVMGVPGYLYSNGVSAIIGWIAGWFLATAFIPIVAYKVRRPKNPPRTFPEFIHLRYEPFQKRSPLRAIVGLLMSIGYFIFVHLQVVGFGIVFSTITGIQYEIALFGFLFFLLFTSIGGFWSVSVTDSVNTIIIVLGVILGAFAVLYSTGGFVNIYENLATTTAPTFEGGESLPKGLLLSPVGGFGFGALCSIFLSNALGAIVSPHWVTRMMAPKNVKTAILQMMLSVLILTLIFIPLIIIGLGAKMLIPSLPAGQTTDYIMPTVITEFAHPIVGAFTLVALCAAAISTANSMLLHAGTSIYYDLYRNLFPDKDFHDEKGKKQLRYLVLTLGFLAVLSAIKPPVLLAMGFTYVYGAFGAVFFFVVLLGLYTKRMNRLAAYANVIVGLVAFIIAHIVGATNPFLVSLVVSFIAVLLSIIIGKKSPLEAYEPYFEVEVSPSTEKVLNIIRNEGADGSTDILANDSINHEVKA
ncbi:sodium:solute symporter family protein [Geobacillus thermodenitrificans]|nr:sodium:solute symporter [Geobacillus thermodenitrificans]PJW22361.1 sodium:solute symporter family protein [Geobacillus thermodenitrificans]